MKKIIALHALFFSLLILLSGCTNGTIVNPTAEGQAFQINTYNYSDNHYLLDTIYKSNFIDFMAEGMLNTPENINRQISPDNFEVWVQTTNFTADRKFASMLIDLPSLPASGQYNDSFYVPGQIPGKRYFGLFRKLNSTEYYVNYQAGFIGLRINIPDNDYAGVTFKQNGTGQTFGTNSANFIQDTLVLKMIKAGNILPQTDTLAWEMKMKNVYRIPVIPILEGGFEFQVNFVDPANPTPSPSLPNGRTVLNVVGLDRFIGHGPQLGQDNYFDFLNGRTIITETGDVIFPILRPFYDGILEATNNGFTGGDTTLICKAIYTKLKSEASIAPNNSMYIIKGRVKNF